MKQTLFSLTGRRAPVCVTSLLFAAFLSAAAAPPAGRAQEAADDEQTRILKTFASEFVDITPGQGRFPRSFEMGDAGANATRPVRTVTFEHSFAMAKYEVPQELFQAVMKKNPSVWGGPRNSVEMVTYRDALLFCREVTRLLRAKNLIAADEVIRLPTEAEWEYCCRAGTSTRYSFGDEARHDADTGLKATRLDPYAWHTGNAAGNDPPVGALKPNAWGLYDMHGYLWEYVADSWHDDFTNAPVDGGAWDAEKEHALRVMRGGSWRDRYDLLQSSTRWPVPDHVRSDAVGFRCVKAKGK